MKVKERRVVASKGCFLVLQTQREKQLENSKKKHESCLESCMIDETPRNEKPSQALAEIMCKPVNVGDKSHYPWACVLSKCNRCPKCVTHDIEKSVTTNDLVIFEHCVNTTRCNKHEGVIGYNLKEEDKVCGRCEEAAKAGKKIGKASTKRELHCSSEPIGVFMENVYLPLLETCRFHCSHMKILGNEQAIQDQHIAFENDPHAILCHRDFAEAMKFQFDGETCGDHFGRNPTVIVEGDLQDTTK